MMDQEIHAECLNSYYGVRKRSGERDLVEFLPTSSVGWAIILEAVLMGDKALGSVRRDVEM